MNYIYFTKLNHLLSDINKVQPSEPFGWTDKSTYIILSNRYINNFCWWILICGLFKIFLPSDFLECLTNVFNFSVYLY